ncbi:MULTISPECIES: DUF1653 domain-containing protein [unclassified Iodobacter]|uniref:DUF1653 domain-containing protein n=1 Tax=unclassified Iodobacter TaxID=235634 RepID=UPI0027BA08CB|nr:DUF1653 domain-containing protein [Iodobacter sp. BJB302]
MYQHNKGPLYQVTGVARHSESEEEMMMYRNPYGDFDLWVWPLTMFTEEITHIGETMPRFRLHSK